jgi:DNA polymerase
MFIGEAPGYHEDQQGLPFVGQSGKYLTELLAMIGLTRNDVFITNVVKCRPPANRDPLPVEIDTCVPAYLNRQIEAIRPKIIATLGRFSMALFFPANARISKIHGEPKHADGRIYYPLFHPAAVLRNLNLRPAMEEDFKRMLALLKEVEQSGDDREDEPPLKQLSLF